MKLPGEITKYGTVSKGSKFTSVYAYIEAAQRNHQIWDSQHPCCKKKKRTVSSDYYFHK